MNSTSSRRPQTAAETQDRVRAGLARRYRAERRFRAYGIAAITFGVAFVIFLFGTVFSQGVSALRQAYLQIDVFYDPEIIDPAGNRDPDDLMVADYQSLVRASLRERFPTVEGRPALRELYSIASSAVGRTAATGDRLPRSHRSTRAALGVGLRYRRHVPERQGVAVRA